ncbi:MAG: hypothetical protein LUC85_01810 [Bacteroidales bacterium]|nr:hypothetical protein [Bacteroidales bacterium]
MKQTTIQAIDADEGKILRKIGTNEYSSYVYLGILDKADNYEEVDISEYNQWLAEQEAEAATASQEAEVKSEE